MADRAGKNVKPVPKKLKELVLAAIKQHSWNMGVSHFKITVDWMENEHENYCKECSQRGVVAETGTNLPYLTATISIYPLFERKWEEEGDQYADDIIAHEVAHILTDPLYFEGKNRFANDDTLHDFRESLTEQVGRMSSKINQYLPRK